MVGEGFRLRYVGVVDKICTSSPDESGGIVDVVASAQGGQPITG